MRKVKLSFIPFTTELLSWAIEKDRRYHTGDKLNQGIESYTSALHDLGFYFKKIVIGELRQNSQTVSTWARQWGWDYRKALRFITIVLRDLFDLNEALKKATNLRERIEAEYRKQQAKARNYMRKFRGFEVTNTKNNIKDDDETEDEKLFLDAMAALAKTNPVYYRAKVKLQLKNQDEGTVLNFKNWLENNRQKRTFPKNIVDINLILSTKLIIGLKVIKYYQKNKNLYHLIFENDFENDMTIEQILEHAK